MELLQIFAHVTTAQLSWHEQKYVASTLLQFEIEQNYICVLFELWWMKSIGEMDL